MKDPTSPKISIIVPVYNVEAYLSKCLDSLLAQSFNDFELLLIDDGSADFSGKICDDYAARDARIKVFHQLNGGVSVARNTGLANSRGEWIAFVDSDDWVEPDWLSVLGRQMQPSIATKADLIFSGRRNIRDEKVSLEFIPTPGRWTTEAILNSDEFYYIALWSCFFRREIIERYSIRLTPGMTVAEDTEFLLKAFAVCRTIVGSNTIHYNYLERKSSATRTVKRDFARASMDIVAVNSFLRFCAANGIDSASFNACVARSYRIFLRVYLSGPNPKREDKRKFVALYAATCVLEPAFKRKTFWQLVSYLWYPTLMVVRALMAGNRLIKFGTAK